MQLRTRYYDNIGLLCEYSNIKVIGLYSPNDNSFVYKDIKYSVLLEPLVYFYYFYCFWFIFLRKLLNGVEV